MELRDLIVTPIIILLVYAVAYMVRNRFTDSVTRKYFLPALTVRIIGALAVGFIYQFYYSGGDTFNYHTYGSRHVWEAFMDDPTLGFKLLTSSGEYGQGTYKYSSKIFFYNDPSSFFVIRISSLFDLLTFSSYSATAVLFAVLSFCGAWMLFIAFYRQSPEIHRWLALATLFVPSVVFWGSGIFKDTLTMAAVGFFTFGVSAIFMEKRFNLSSFLWIILSLWVLFSVKKYILLCFLPAIILWIYAYRVKEVRSTVLKVLLVPFVVMLIASSGYFAVTVIGKDDKRYSIDKIAITAQITAYDIAHWTGRGAGSTYDLGDLDGTYASMVSKFPQAVNVSLFRPYLWEVRNPLMMLSALESFTLLILTITMVYRARKVLTKAISHPTVVFCLIFSITFAFAVGISTYNFGTLVRYKIPLMPFYLLGMIYMNDYLKRDRNVEVLDVTE